MSSGRNTERGLARLAALTLVSVALIVCIALVFAQRRGAREQQGEQRRDGAALVVTVRAGGNLQRALDAARPGDTIMLEAGATYPGPFTLPRKAGGDGWIIVRTTTADSALRPGERVAPAQAHLLAKLVAPGRGEPALRTEAGAHHYRLVGLEFSTVTADAHAYDLVVLGDGGPTQTSVERVPHHITIDRCFVHAHPTQELKRGVQLNSAHTEIINSHISGFKVKGQEAQAVGGWNGPGPFLIENNYLEGAGENIMFGGARANTAALVPADITIRRNHLRKPADWRGKWTVKNLLELKNARRVKIDGNLMEGNWLDAQQGYAVLFTPRPTDSSEWAAVEDVEFTNNVVRSSAAGLHVSGQDDLFTPAPRENRLKRVRIANNVFSDISYERWGGDGCFLKIGAGAEEVTVEHNTVMHDGNITKAWGDPIRRFVFKDNLLRHNDYGIIGDGLGPGAKSIERYFPAAVFAGNVIIGAPEHLYPPRNFYPSSTAEVRFANLSNGDFRLAPSSPFKGRATDGRDPGCDFSQLPTAQ
ncbi:MAG TPA: hypothetical protein VFX96_00265 [Pyrinomonadaceae bacterium]|nr:hypothetical protein [Pyrinomonadaceae bacterium]